MFKTFQGQHGTGTDSRSTLGQRGDRKSTSEQLGGLKNAQGDSLLSFQ